MVGRAHGNARAHRGCDTLRDVADPLASVASACRRLTETRKPRATVQKKYFQKDDEPVRWGLRRVPAGRRPRRGHPARRRRRARISPRWRSIRRHADDRRSGRDGQRRPIRRLPARRRGRVPRAAASAPADPPPSRAPATTTAPTATFAPHPAAASADTSSPSRRCSFPPPAHPRVGEAGATAGIRVVPSAPKRQGPAPGRTGTAGYFTGGGGGGTAHGGTAQGTPGSHHAGVSRSFFGGNTAGGDVTPASGRRVFGANRENQPRTSDGTAGGGATNTGGSLRSGAGGKSTALDSGPRIVRARQTKTSRDRTGCTCVSRRAREREGAST